MTLLVIILVTLVPGVVASENAHEHNTLGVSYYDNREWAEAIHHFHAALNADPLNATIKKNLSNAYQAYANDLASQGDYPGALRELRQAIQLDPSNPSPLMQAGAYSLHAGQNDEAIFRLEEAIELSPGDVDAHFLLGEAYYRDNDVRSALEQWEWVYEMAPEKPGLADRIAAARRDAQVESEFRGRSSLHFNVTYDREAEGRLVHDVLRILEEAYRDIGVKLRAYPETPIQVSLYTSAGFAESTQLEDHVGAVYDGTKIRIPVIDASGREIPVDEIRRRLYHEYVHVAVRHIAKRQVPWWLNEGLAEALTRDLSRPELELLRRARAQEAWFSLAELEEGQLDRLSVEDLYLAYKQSHATVAYLEDRHGARRFGPMLESLARGDDVETALRRHFRQNFQTLDLAVADYIRR